ncbi:MAG: sodium dependent phosphate transporter [Actinomycetota bacterium]|jgi:sodium-dependent phosphate cotransporter
MASGDRQFPRWARGLVVIGLIYLFLSGVSALEAGIKSMGADTQERLFSSVSNPLVGLFVGLLGTVLVQSSSASTSVIVGLVASGAVGLDQAVPMIMGANLGTTVTNTLVSLGHVRQSNEFRRALSAATVHDFFNLMAVLVLLPVELLTGRLSWLAASTSDLLLGSGGADWESPIKALVKVPVEALKDLGGGIGLSGTGLGVALVGIGLGIVLVSLISITGNMKALIAERLERSMNRVLGRGGGLVAILVGMAVTIAVQSSSITTSILIPMSAAGVITLRNAYPVTLGANVGTTITALLAALAASGSEALTIALVHTWFNVLGIVILFGIPILRPLPIKAAELLADLAVRRRSVAVGWTLGVFIIGPLIGIAVFR